MRKLEKFLIILAIIGIFVGIIFLIFGGGFAFFGIELFVGSIIVLVGVIFESERYKPTQDDHKGWECTNERFIDHTTGKLMDVYYNPKTGERSYREVEE